MIKLFKKLRLEIGCYLLVKHFVSDQPKNGSIQSVSFTVDEGQADFKFYGKPPKPSNWAHVFKREKKLKKSSLVGAKV